MAQALAALIPYLTEALGSSGVGGALAQVGSGALTGAEGALGSVGGVLGPAASALGVGQAGVPGLAGVTQGGAPLATSTAPVMGGLEAPATAGLIGSGGQVGAGGILPQFGIGLGRAELGLPAQNVGFNPQTFGTLLGSLPSSGQGDARSQQQVALLMQLLQNLRRQGMA